MPDDAAHLTATEELSRLVRHAEYLRQINSNKAFGLQRRSRGMTIATVVVAAAITFVGFTGTVKLREQLEAPLGWSQQAIDLTYNLLVLAVLLLTIIALIYRLPERAAQHERAIQTLTEFIRLNEATARAAERGATVLSLADSEGAAERYIAVTSSLPPSTDKEFLKAKRDYAVKRRRSKAAEGKGPEKDARPATAASSGQNLTRDLQLVVLDSPNLVAILKLLSKQSDFELWLAGGAVRNAVWDRHQKYEVPTPLEDVDVVWFDPKRADPSFDREIERRLTAAAPNVKWDVKNQARMHDALDVGARSLEDSMKTWPETASAVAVRMSSGELKLLAPFGLGDLFSLTVRRAEQAHADRFTQRVEAKRWPMKWPSVVVVADPETPEGDRP